MLSLIFSVIFQVSASEVCSDDFSAVAEYLGTNHQALVWMETTQDDGKPLFIHLKDENSKVYLVFNKSKEGPWAEGPAKLCRAEGSLVNAKISKQNVKLGSALPTLIRWGFSAAGANFRLLPMGTKEKPELKISTVGWGGVFVPSDVKALEMATKQSQ
jgi:hypothetical protein